MGKHTKPASIRTKCICGESLLFQIEKPSYFEPTITKITCPCGTRYMVCAMINKQTGDVDLVPQVLEASDTASEAARKQILARSESEL